MFYAPNPDMVLRFGDITAGYVSSIPVLKEPLSPNKHSDYKLELSVPPYCAILSPCCSMGDSTLTLASLQPLTGNFFKNPHFVEDLTRINRHVAPGKAMAASDWERLTDEEKAKRLAKGSAYTFAEFFIYAEHDLIQPRYTVTYRGTEYDIGSYAVDFRRSFRISCQLVKSSNEGPADPKLLNSKILQLSIDAREDLRLKMASYYNRRPVEDEKALEA